MFSMMMLLTLTTMMFIFIKNPMSMGIALMIQVILISLISGLMSQNFWFSYVLFLIVVGGLLIMFIYMTSVASNEKFKFSMKMFMSSTVSITMILMLNLMDTPFDMVTLNMDMNLTHDHTWLEMLYLNKYLNFPSSLLTITMIVYLLVTLIAVVNISNIYKGPLRKI